MNKWSEVFIYDDSVPSRLRTKYQRGPRNAGEPVGWQRDDGYWLVGFNSKNLLVHRVIFEIFYGAIPDGWQVDHIDGDCTNNNPENLRAVEHAVNQRNMSKNRRNSSGITGVSRTEVIGKSGKVFVYWVASWCGPGRENRSSHFSVLKYGEDCAMKMAIEKRSKEIQKLNLNGFNYSERHGK